MRWERQLFFGRKPRLSGFIAQERCVAGYLKIVHVCLSLKMKAAHKHLAHKKGAPSALEHEVPNPTQLGRLRKANHYDLVVQEYSASSLHDVPNSGVRTDSGRCYLFPPTSNRRIGLCLKAGVHLNDGFEGKNLRTVFCI